MVHASQLSAAAAHAMAPLPAGDRLRLSSSRDRHYATRLRQLVHLDVADDVAAELWQEAAVHRVALSARLDRDVGMRVALLDYVLNIRQPVGPGLYEPQIIERSALESIKQQALIDPLTGLFNRGLFDVELAREVERCRRREASASSLVLLDLDEFKSVNDDFGHRVGDAVLEAVGDVIMRHVRAADVSCRIGGDEFAVILPDTPQPDALMVAERIRADVPLMLGAHPLSGHPGRATASGGIATMPMNARTAEELFQRADEALYRAKGAGGDRITVAEAMT